MYSFIQWCKCTQWKKSKRLFIYYHNHTLVSLCFVISYTRVFLSFSQYAISSFSYIFPSHQHHYYYHMTEIGNYQTKIHDIFIFSFFFLSLAVRVTKKLWIWWLIMCERCISHHHHILTRIEMYEEKMKIKLKEKTREKKLTFARN